MNIAALLLAGVVGVVAMRPGAPMQEPSGSAEASKSSQTAPRSGEPDAKGVYRVGGVVRPPVLVSRVDPE